MDRFARIQEILSDKVDDFLFYIKQPLNWRKWLLFALVLIVLITPIFEFALSLTKTAEKERIQIEMANKWIDQLPSDHWLHDQRLPNGDAPYALLQKASMQLTSSGQAALANAMTFMKYNYPLTYELARANSEQVQQTKKKSYVLKSTTNKVFTPCHNLFPTKIALKVSEDLKLEFFYKDQLIAFDIAKPNGKNLKTPPFVISYIEDPTIATITNGTIKGVHRGETALVLGIAEHVLEYQIVVE